MLTLAKSSDVTKQGHRWQKGQSGNPSGNRIIDRPGAVDIGALARSYAPEAMKTLVHCLRDPRYKLQAAIAILDRGYGKPTVSIQSQSEATVLHLVAAEAVGNALIEAIGERPAIDAVVDAGDDEVPTE